MSIPIEIFNKIMLYNSHPTADVFRSGYKGLLNLVEEVRPFSDTTFYDAWSLERTNLKHEKEEEQEHIELEKQWRIHKLNSPFVYDSDNDEEY